MAVSWGATLTTSGSVTVMVGLAVRGTFVHSANVIAAWMNVDGAVRSQGGKVAVKNDLVLFGSWTHAPTKNVAKTVNLKIAGRLTISSGGSIDVDYKSTYTRAGRNTGYKTAYYQSHGGEGSSSSASSVPYGNFRNPTTMGAMDNDGSRGGGLVRLTVGSLRLDGTITARGYHDASGGSINIRVSGAVEGSGTLDVGVHVDSTGMYYGGGGGWPLWGTRPSPRASSLPHAWTAPARAGPEQARSSTDRSLVAKPEGICMHTAASRPATPLPRCRNRSRSAASWQQGLCSPVTVWWSHAKCTLNQTSLASAIMPAASPFCATKVITARMAT